MLKFKTTADYEKWLATCCQPPKPSSNVVQLQPPVVKFDVPHVGTDWRWPLGTLVVMLWSIAMIILGYHIYDWVN